MGRVEMEGPSEGFPILDVDCRRMNIRPPEQLFGWVYPRKVHHVLARNSDGNAMVICGCRKGPTCQLSGDGGGTCGKLELLRDCSRHLEKANLVCKSMGKLTGV